MGRRLHSRRGIFECTFLALVVYALSHFLSFTDQLALMSNFSPTAIMQTLQIAPSPCRNNLYWVSRHECMCLWYGVIEKNSQFVTVLPIGTTTDLSGHEITTAKDGDKTLEVLQVKRSRLIPLDDEVLHSSCTNDMLRDFGLALLIFADWDDYARDSYVWPEFINRLMGSRHGLESWFKMSVMHPPPNVLEQRRAGQSFYFLYVAHNILV
jgi:hypothetical protein